MEQIASEFHLTFFIFRRNSVQAVDQITIDRIVIFFVETDSQKLFQILQLCHTIHDICTICLFDDQLFFLIILILDISNDSSTISSIVTIPDVCPYSSSTITIWLLSCCIC